MENISITTAQEIDNLCINSISFVPTTIQIEELIQKSFNNNITDCCVIT